MNQQQTKLSRAAQAKHREKCIDLFACACADPRWRENMKSAMRGGWAEGRLQKDREWRRAIGRLLARYELMQDHGEMVLRELSRVGNSLAEDLMNEMAEIHNIIREMRSKGMD